jgi:hypothetical protein
MRPTLAYLRIMRDGDRTFARTIGFVWGKVTIRAIVRLYSIRARHHIGSVLRFPSFLVSWYSR